MLIIVMYAKKSNHDREVETGPDLCIGYIHRGPSHHILNVKKKKESANIKEQISMTLTYDN